MSDQDDRQKLRDAAAALRSSSDPKDLALADWFDGEAAVLGEMTHVAELFAASVDNASGLIGSIRIVKTDLGDVAMQAQSTPAALRLAQLILDGE